MGLNYSMLFKKNYRRMYENARKTFFVPTYSRSPKQMVEAAFKRNPTAHSFMGPIVSPYLMQKGDAMKDAKLRIPNDSPY